jgi:hypothetical protein
VFSFIQTQLIILQCVDSVTSVLLGGNLDLENFGKEKMKKEKPFNMDEVDGALPEVGSISEEDGDLEVDGNLVIRGSENNVFLQVWKLPVCNLLALMFFIIVGYRKFLS